MRIALLTDGIWPNVIGGMQKHSYYLLKYLSANGISITVYYPKKDGKPETHELQNTENVSFVPVQKDKVVRFPGHYLRQSYLYSKEIFAKIQHVRFDLIYIQGFAGWYTIANKSKLEFDTPLVLNFHGLEMFQKPADLRSFLEQLMFRPFVRRLLRKADYVQSLGGKLTEILISLNIPRKRVLTHGNGVDGKWIREDLPESKSSVRSFIFIGRWERRKGVQELNAALRNLDRSNFIFHFVGPIPKEEQVPKENIKYYGQIKDHNQIFQLLDESDVLVCPSHSEGMPTVILEAMARGTAILTTDVGANSELVSDHNGCLLAKLSPEILTKKLEAFIDMDEKELVKMKLHSFLVARKFDWDAIAKGMIESFKTISTDKAGQTK